jgi:hypothetical protein
MMVTRSGYRTFSATTSVTCPGAEKEEGRIRGGSKEEEEEENMVHEEEKR